MHDEKKDIIKNLRIKLCPSIICQNIAKMIKKKY